MVSYERDRVQLKTRLKDLIEESLNSTVPVISTTVDLHEDFAVYHSTLDTEPQLYVDIRLTNFDDEKTVADVVFYPAGRNFKALNVFGTKGSLSILKNRKNAISCNKIDGSVIFLINSVPKIQRQNR